MNKLLTTQKYVFKSLIHILPKTIIREIIYGYIEPHYYNKFVGYLPQRLYLDKSLITIWNNKLVLGGDHFKFCIIDMITDEEFPTPITSYAHVIEFNDNLFVLSDFHYIHIDNKMNISESYSNIHIPMNSQVLVNTHYIIVLIYVDNECYNIRLYNHNCNSVGEWYAIDSKEICEILCDDDYIYFFNMNGVIIKYLISEYTVFKEYNIGRNIYGQTMSSTEIYITSMIEDKCVISVWSKDFVKIREWSVFRKWFTLFTPMVYYKNSLFLVNEDKIEMWKQYIE